MWSRIKLRATISIKITLLYTLILCGILLFTSLLTYAGIQYYFVANAKKDVKISMENVKRYLEAGNSLAKLLSKETLLIPGVRLKVFDEQNNPLGESGSFNTVKQLRVADDEYSIRHHNLPLIQLIAMEDYFADELVFGNYGVYHLQFIRRMSVESHFLKVLTEKMLMANILGLFVVVISGVFVSRRILRPIRDIIDTTKEIEINNLEKRLDESSPKDELQELAKTINHMLTRIQTGVEQHQRFISAASHELRTPITVISGYVNMLDRWGKHDAFILDEGVAAIKSEASSMQNLIEKLLFLASVDQGEQMLKKEPLEMEGLIQEVFQETRVIAPDHKIALDKNDPAVIWADASAIKQLLRIFVENSIKYTPAGGSINLAARKTGDHLTVTVQDTGIGIPEEEQPKIFDRFYRVDKSRSKVTGGTGLGLSIARWIVEQHSSTIHLFSKPGKGTVITVIFPVCCQPGRPFMLPSYPRF